ncbi:unnamed protein product [Gongylonema pulchrum]|uniref:Protein kinase domain-containing protein n=1 Tax=Gongylonema pulchrum TaxID=637853 RepID=A0A183CWU7_9BILA|nr:unnamed protein product [Gongylonema pulchrum]
MNRSQVTLEELLGDGQFGNVYRGKFTKEDGQMQSVAVKVCKVDSEPTERQNFLEEAYAMQRFRHEHIIALVGICMDTPLWIVMELAPYGEVAPLLKVDSSAMPTSTLWRTLEQQKIQSEEDDKWLEEEEEKLLPLPALSTVRTHHLNSLSGSQPILSEQQNGLPAGYEFDRRGDTIHEAVFKVVGAVKNLSECFQSTMSAEKFTELVKTITDELKNLFVEIPRHVNLLKLPDQREVKLVEALLDSDMRSLTDAMKKAVDEDISEEAYEAVQREILKITHRLAFNCKHFLESVDSARIRSDVAKLHHKDAPITHLV